MLSSHAITYRIELCCKGYLGDFGWCLDCYRYSLKLAMSVDDFSLLLYIIVYLAKDFEEGFEQCQTIGYCIRNRECCMVSHRISRQQHHTNHANLQSQTPIVSRIECMDS